MAQAPPLNPFGEHHGEHLLLCWLHRGAMLVAYIVVGVNNNLVPDYLPSLAHPSLALAIAAVIIGALLTFAFFHHSPPLVLEPARESDKKPHSKIRTHAADPAVKTKPVQPDDPPLDPANDALRRQAARSRRKANQKERGPYVLAPVKQVCCSVYLSVSVSVYIGLLLCLSVHIGQAGLFSVSVCLYQSSRSVADSACLSVCLCLCRCLSISVKQVCCCVRLYLSVYISQAGLLLCPSVSVYIGQAGLLLCLSVSVCLYRPSRSVCLCLSVSACLYQSSRSVAQSLVCKQKVSDKKQEHDCVDAAGCELRTR